MSTHHLREALFAALGLLTACGGESTAASTTSTGAGGGRDASAGTAGTGAGTAGGAGANVSGGASGSAGSGDSGGSGSAGSGGSAENGGGGGSAGAAGQPRAELACTSPKPSADYRGVEECDRGGLRRAEAVACPTAPLGSNDFECTPTQPEQSHACTHDADCTAKPFGFCAIDTPLSFTYGCACQYGCVQDDDCGAGFACLCGSTVGRCIPATCRTNGDCASGSCRLGETPCGSRSLSCAAPTDTCDGPLDCNGGQCATGGTGFACGSGCGVGRPLSRQGDGGPIVARLLRHDAWC